MSVIGSNILAGASGQGGYFIDRSLRFRASASAYLSRTLSSGSRTAWTVSYWAKLSGLGTNRTLLNVGGLSSGYGLIFFNNADRIDFQELGGSTARLTTNRLYRDPSAWYHIVCVWDSSNVTAADRMRIYTNGVRETSFTTQVNPALNALSAINTASLTRFGWDTSSTSGWAFDGYLTEVNFIDGQALDPTDFGEYNEDTGVWQAKKYTGTYGTNGFYLNFSDNSSTTTLGEDGSGNGNDWTLNNFSLTSGSTYDSMTDVPTLTSETQGNYATLNPTFAMSGVTTGSTIVDGNLKKTAGTDTNAVCSMALSSGSWYWEITIENVAPGNIYCGLLNIDSATFVQWRHTGATSGTTSTPTIATYTLGDTLSFAYDADNNRVYYGKNGVWQNSADPSAGSGFLTPTTSVAKYPFGRSQATQYLAFNFGQRPFAYTPPTGFKALNTYNLPDSTVKDGSKQFNPVLYTGNGSTQSITGVGFQPDFVWVKGRNNAGNHLLADTVRGALKSLASNTTNAETDPDTNGLTSFDVDGFSAGSATRINGSGNTYVAWNWKANGSGVSNTDGSIASTVSANPTAGFSIITYTTLANTVGTVGHGLGVVPDMVIAKTRTTSAAWNVWHKDILISQRLRLDDTSAATSSAVWNSTLPTADVFTQNISTTVQNAVSYCFASIEGYSKFGSYTGNGSTDGPFVYTGFRPAFVIVKGSSSVTNWHMVDSARDVDNPAEKYLLPNSSQAEGTVDIVDCLSNGFKLRNSAISINASGGTYIYMAFAENPFKNALAR